MSTIVICEFMDEGAVAELAQHHSLRYDANLVDRPDDLLREMADCRALLVRNRTQVRGTLLAAAPHLQVIGRLGVGLDNIDLPACKARDIEVCPATGANDVAVAEYVICAAMMLTRGAYGATPALIAGQWPRDALGRGREINDCTLGLVGFGAIARETARRASALGLAIVAHDPFVPDTDPAWHQLGVTPVDFAQLVESADIISLHLPLTKQTHYLFNHAVLSAMKSTAILINAARGGIVDEAALVASLKAGELRGAALDVFEREPLDGVHGAMFAGVPNLILTPHIAGVTEESNIRVSGVTADNVLRVLAARA